MSAAMAIHPVMETANDRFKRDSEARLWQSLLLAVVVHAAILALWPGMTVAAPAEKKAPVTVVPIPNVPIPQAPERLRPPPTPVISTTAPVDDVPYTVPNFYEVMPETPPPLRGDAASEEYRAWTPSMVAPRLLNEAEVRRALERYYPPLLRDAGVGGTVGVLFWIDETGKVQQAKIAQSSGYPALDEAALKVADLMRLSPALNRGAPVRVMVTLPITFSTSH